jgi:hypothetical protein
MEDAFSLLYIARDFPEIYKRARGRSPAPGQRQDIEDFLKLVFGVLVCLDAPAQSTGYDRLVASLESGDTLLTLNYDTLLDSSLWRHGWNPKRGYGLLGGADKIRWSPKPNPSSTAAGGVRLLKLHGSVNWFVKGSFSQLEAVFTKKPVRVTLPRRNEISGHVRQIIPPLYGKTFKHDHWRGLWDQAHRALREAEGLVVIGSSLLDTDFHLRALVSRVARWRKKQGSLFRFVIVVDPKLEIRRKWQRVLRGTTRRWGSIKWFDQFLRQELSS